MDENIISSLIERVQAGMNELSPLIRQISDCIEREQFVTEQTKDAVIQSLSNLSELQLQLTRMLNQSGHTKDMTGLTGQGPVSGKQQVAFPLRLPLPPQWYDPVVPTAAKPASRLFLRYCNGLVNQTYFLLILILFAIGQRQHRDII